MALKRTFGWVFGPEKGLWVWCAGRPASICIGISVIIFFKRCEHAEGQVWRFGERTWRRPNREVQDACVVVATAVVVRSIGVTEA